MRSRTPRSSDAKLGEVPTSSVPAQPDHGENSASTIVETPLKPRRGRLDAHDFPDGGGRGVWRSLSSMTTRPTVLCRLARYFRAFEVFLAFAAVEALLALALG